MKSNFDKDLAWYYTNVDHLRALFQDYVSASTLPKHIIAIHGVGGVGKSSLLRMFRLYCNNANIPIALVSGDEAKSAIDVLIHWSSELKENNVTLRSFNRTFERWRAIQAQVDKQARRENTGSQRAADIAGKAASKTGEAAGGALAGAAIGSIIPGAGTAIGGVIGGVLGGMGIEALVDWLKGFLSKPDIDLLLDPAKELSSDFLNDIERLAKKQRIVLMIDTFEQMSAMDDWVRDVTQRLSDNILLVVAGRALPNWTRVWPSWLAYAHVEALEPLTKDAMRELVHRYYATMRGGNPDPKQTEAIIEFARGLPMVVASAVRLWVEYGVEDFQAVRPRVVADLVDRLMEGVPSQLVPTIESAAVVRYFDRPILRSVMELTDIRAAYQELQKFPFMRSRAEGLSMHDSVREILDENLRIQDFERYNILHKRAAVYFENRLKDSTGEEYRKLELERLYHRICIDEASGLDLFQSIAEEMVRYQLINPLQSLLSDANVYPMKRESSKLWRKYYNARLDHFSGKVSDAEKMYQVITESVEATPKLKAYALNDWGAILTRYETLSYDGGVEKATETLLRSGDLVPMDSHLVESFSSLAKIARYRGEWDEQRQYLEKLRAFYENEKDNYGVLRALTGLKEASTLRGDWGGVFTTHNYAESVVGNLTKSPAPKAMLLGRWVWAWALAGRYSKCESQAKQALKIARELQDDFTVMLILRDLGWALGWQEKFSEAHKCFVESMKIAYSLGELYLHDQGVCLGLWGLVSCRAGNFRQSRNLFKKSRQIILNISNTPTTIILYSILGLAVEIEGKLAEAETYYSQCRKWESYGNNYFYASALTGLVRLKQKQREYDAIPPLVTEAERLALQYEYNDCLASLKLTQALAMVEMNDALSSDYKSTLTSSHTSIPEDEKVFEYFKQSLVYALRYNRFLLDEVLVGRSKGSSLTPIIPYLLARGDEGKETLIRLSNWWKSGSNDVGAQRPDTIAPISEGISLIEAETIVRKHEPGDGKPQKLVIEQIEEALKMYIDN